MNDEAKTEDAYGSESALNGTTNPYYAAARAKAEWDFTKKDTTFAFFAFALGMLFWDWIPSPWYDTGISVALFFAVAATVTGVYLHSIGFRQNRRSLPALTILLAGALPFALYDGTAIFLLLFLFELAVSLIWIMNTCGRSVTERLSGYIIVDAVNQMFVVPFANFAGAFKALTRGAKEGKRSRRGLYAFIGIVCSVPVVTTVISLLISADKGFADLMGHVFKVINPEMFGRYLIELLIGAPIACYIYGSAFGNGHGRCAGCLTRAGADESLSQARRIPLAAVRPGLVILAAVYILFFIAMGTYLFSAFSGDLPAGYTYAEYARRGFFELCGVSAINLAVIIFVYLFAKRNAGEDTKEARDKDMPRLPKSLRLFTASISCMTMLLLLTAASKMLLYVNTFGLTRMRVYTLWFMLLMLCVFTIVLLWHIRPFNAGRPIAIAFAVLVLCLFFANTDGLIAKYNVESYESGALKTVDIEMLTYMSDATVPYLERLKDDAPDDEVRTGAQAALRERAGAETYLKDTYGSSWRGWNLESSLAVASARFGT
ncbi:MAG: DUF4173 domain-containing protein [Clostridiales Family XIII bacterium]|jgi:hypothetical protein|nr:DUF4173 domain-containing protein [Clostridiales Family XIII bacterium]